MRRLLFIILTGSSLAICQTAPKEKTVDYIVWRMLSHESPMYGAYSGSDQKQLSSVGDAAPAAETRFLEGKNLTATDIRLALLIIEFSFVAPAEIKVESDRGPKAALLLLQRLQGLPAASDLKDEFADTKRVLRRASKGRTQ